MANKSYKDKQKRFAPKLKIKAGDMVVVISGDYKGEDIREVLEIFPHENRAIVDGVNIRKKHVRPSENDEGGIVNKPAPIHLSNLMVVDPETNEPSRIGRRRNDAGKLERYSKKTGNTLA